MIFIKKNNMNSANFVTEEEKKRILEMHSNFYKDSINEQYPNLGPKPEGMTDTWPIPNTTPNNENPWMVPKPDPNLGKYMRPLPPQPEVEKRPASQPNPLVKQIQDKLLGLKINIGPGGADGKMGSKTLQGILTALKGLDRPDNMGAMASKPVAQVTS